MYSDLDDLDDVFNITGHWWSLPGKGLVAAQRLSAWICSLYPEVKAELVVSDTEHFLAQLRGDEGEVNLLLQLLLIPFCVV